MKRNHRALIVVCALLVVAFSGCGEKPQRPASAPVVPVLPKAEIIVEGVPAEDQPALKSLLRVDGVMRKGEEYVVAINGQVVKGGEFLRLTVKKRSYILEVMGITAQRILLKATTKAGDAAAATTPPPIENPNP